MVSVAIRRSGAVGALYARVGEELRRRRRDLRLKQEELALRVHLSRASIANVEAGRQAIPVHHLVELAEALGTVASDILKAAEAQAVDAVEPLPVDAPRTVRAASGT
ncbi:helix-turn-helix domain-containing protein [Leptolyngbya sp. 15MV]|nr:helix-turn-helix domain-containing protein [Leptolyngbya sp. 15MV]